MQAPLSEGSPWAVAFALAGGATLETPHLLVIDAELGPRRALTRVLFAGVPLFASFEEAQPHMGRGSWSVGVGLELGAAF